MESPLDRIGLEFRLCVVELVVELVKVDLRRLGMMRPMVGRTNDGGVKPSF